MTGIKNAVKKLLNVLLPIQKKKIVFINFNGKGYGDNPKYIAQELIRQKVACDMVWLVSNMDEPMPEQIRKVPFGSAKAKLELMSAGIWVSNVRNHQGVDKRRKQFYIQTWHASYSPKLLEKAAADILGPQLVAAFSRDGRITDLMLSNSRLQTQEYRENFWYDGEILECGMPRNDFLVNAAKDAETMARIRREVGIADNEKVVIYAPTFRDTGRTDCYNVDFERLVNAAQRLYGCPCKLLVRLHPNIADQAEMFQYSDRVINASPYPDMQELLLISDMLVTDYSTSIFDIAMLDRDVVVYVPDVQEYQRERGLKQSFFELPFPRAESEEALYHCVENYRTIAPRERILEFMDTYESYDTGTASAAVCQRIKEHLK